MRIYCPNPACVDSRGRRTVLAEVIAGYYVVRHSRREFVAPAMTSIRCDNCGRVWRPEDADSPVQSGEPG